MSNGWGVNASAATERTVAKKDELAAVFLEQGPQSLSTLVCKIIKNQRDLLKRQKWSMNEKSSKMVPCLGALSCARLGDAHHRQEVACSASESLSDYVVQTVALARLHAHSLVADSPGLP